MEWSNELLTLLLIPIISAFVGWGTNSLAVKMMFYPLEFVGIKPFLGWQGLIPSKRKKMAEIEVELVLDKLLSVEEIVSRLEAEKVNKAIEKRLKQVVKRIVNEILEEAAPTLWASLPVQAKNIVYARVEYDIPNIISNMLADFQHNVSEILNIRELVVGHLVDNPELINEIFLKSGEKEFPFIERSGFYFGFLFGIPTMLIWHYYQLWWILPVGGLLVGYLTNWIALTIIFEPKRPVKFLGMTFQGMFLKRQKEVSKVYSDIIEKKLLSSENIIKAVFYGSGSVSLLEIIELHVNDAIERYVAIAQPYFALTVGSEKYFKMKKLAVKRVFEGSEKSLAYLHEYADEALHIGEDLCEKMQQLTPEEFEGVLRPAYKQDEWKLIVIGALLGMGAGYLQLYFIF